MIKNYTTLLSRMNSSAAFGVVSSVVVLFAWFILDRNDFFGFLFGLVAFGAAFSGIEMVLRRVFIVGAIKQGVLDSLFWVVIKFLGPMVVLYLGVRQGYPVFWLFVGLFVGLINVAVILFVRLKFDVKSR